MPLLYHNGEKFVQANFAKLDFGLDVYLCCPGPSLEVVEPGPGRFIVAMNTAYPTIPKPDLFLTMDGAQCYDRSVWMQPFPKIIGSKYMDDTIADRSLAYYPNVYVATGTGGGIHEIFQRRGPNADFLWVGNSFWISIHLLVWMGAKRIHLVGCDFGGKPRPELNDLSVSQLRKRLLSLHVEHADIAGKGTKKRLTERLDLALSTQYCHDDVKMTPQNRMYNKNLYTSLCQNLPLLRSEAEKHDIEIISCTPGSPANKYLKYIPLKDALQASDERVPEFINKDIFYGAFAEVCQWRPTKKDEIAGSQSHPDGVDGVLVASDKKAEWMLPWWWERYHKHNSHPVAFIDLGMSDSGKAFCEARGRLIPIQIPDGLGMMHITPLCLLKTPFRRTVWMDLDCEVRQPIGELFGMIGEKCGFHRDPFTPFPAGNPDPIAGGVVAYHFGEPIISEWAEHVVSGKYQTNQDALNTMIQPRMSRVQILPKKFQWLRMEGDNPLAAIMHWTGPIGHDHIHQMVTGEYGAPKVSILMPAYNAGEFIESAIRSTLAQSYQNWELVIVNDGSTDDTLKVARAWADTDKRIRIESIEHSGYIPAFNKCFELATGDIIARLDADDGHDTRRIETCVNFLGVNKGKIDIVSCEGMVLIDKKLKGRLPNKAMNVEEFVKGGTTANPIEASLVAWKKVYDDVGGFREEFPLAPACDWNLRAILKGMRWGHVPAPFYIYRQHPGQIGRLNREQQKHDFKAAIEAYHAAAS